MHAAGFRSCRRSRRALRRHLRLRLHLLPPLLPKDLRRPLQARRQVSFLKLLYTWGLGSVGL